ncbi:porin family protein [Janthinobacterium sp. LB3P118]|uniref:porin family protein n=1 Tax=Janthinobacterium sp. LB3P118 TaxID=3424195 RepID=UPI003F2821CF
MKIIIASAAIILANAAVSCAQAEDLYVGANIGPRADGHVDQRADGVTTRYDAVTHQRRAGMFAGYVLSPVWALETGYQGFGGTTDFPLAGGRMAVGTKLAYLAARGTWRLSDDWSLYGKAGVAQGRLKIDLAGGGVSDARTVHKNGVYLAAGAAWRVTGDVSLQLEFEHTDKIKNEGFSADMEKVSLGVRFGF